MCLSSQAVSGKAASYAEIAFSRLDAEGMINPTCGSRRPMLIKGVKQVFPDFVEGSGKMDQIVRAAAACFQEKGYPSTTLNDIAEAVRLQKPTLYHYVRSKNQLLFLVLSGTAESYNRALERVAVSPLDPVAKLKQAIRQHILLQLQHPGTVSLFRDVGHLDKPYQEHVQLALKRYRQLLQTIIREGIDRGDFAPRDPSLSVLLLLGSLNFVHRWYHADGPAGIADIANFYADTLVQALRAPQAQTLPAQVSTKSRSDK
jgi:AcrR family transcriptional regulator